MKRLRYRMVDERPTRTCVRFMLKDTWMAYTCPASASRFVAHYRDISDTWITVNDFITVEAALAHIMTYYDSIGAVIVT